MVGQYRKQSQMVNNQAARVGQPLPNTIGDDVQGLLQFAGAGMGVATNYLNEKVQKDAIKQQRQVAQGQMPTSDATQGGYRAAKALGTELAMERYKARAAELAQQDLSDEDFDTSLTNLQVEIGQEIDGRFPEMASDEELLTLRDMSFIDSVPQITYAREANKLKREQEKRGTDFQSWVLSTKGMSDQDLVEGWKDLSGALQLSEGNAEELGVSAIVNSGDEQLLDQLSRMSDSKGVAFTDKYGEIGSALERVKSDRMADELHITSKTKQDMMQGLSNGTMTDSQAMEIVKANRANYGDGFMTDNQVESMFNHARAQRAETGRIRTLAYSSGSVPKKDQPMVANQLMSDTYQRLSRQYTEEQLQDPKTQSTIYSQSVNEVATDLNNRGIVNSEWQDSFKNISAADPKSMIATDSQGNEHLTQQSQMILNTWKALPEATKARYADGSRARILNEYDKLTKSGMPEPLAFRQAQELERMPKHTNVGEKYEQSVRITDELYTHWIDSDVPNSQLMGVERQVQNLMDSGFSEESIITNLKENSFQLENGQVVFANQNAVMDALDVQTPDRVNQILMGFKKNNEETIKQRVSYLGGSYEDAYPTIDVNTGTLTFYSSDGFPLSGLTYPLSTLREEFTEGLYNEPEEETIDNSNMPEYGTMGLYSY